MSQQFPFSAVVGCELDAGHDGVAPGRGLDDMGLALVLTTISPQIGGVLIRGEKGTAKSTAVRALAAVLPPIAVYQDDRFSIDPADTAATSPDGPFGPDAETTTRPVRLVELPIGATEDRVLGSLHLQSALAAGRVEFEPGLLARAHRGVLYVDEVNLLHDHLVDLLLDAAAMGRASVERDGVSVEHEARFVLIGTMNPEEGELRPQLLDRFGLTVEVRAPRDAALRAEVVRRRMAYDADPAGFRAAFAATEALLTDRILAAGKLIDQVTLPDAALRAIAEVCAAFEVDGLRADIVTARTAVAHAAWEGRTEVTRADIRRAAVLALPHRRRRNPFDAPGLDETLLDELLDRWLGDDPDDDPDSPDDHRGPDDPEGDRSVDESPSDQDAAGPDPGAASPRSRENPSPENGSDLDVPADEADAEPPPADLPPPGPPEPSHPDADRTRTTTVGTSDPYRVRLLTARGVGVGAAGRRSRALTATGRRVGAEPMPASGGGGLHLVETLRAAATRHAAGMSASPHASASSSTSASSGMAGDARLRLRREDLRRAVREGQEANLVLFCVDASGSMAARRRMRAVKTAILSLLLDAYRRRDKVGLITFRGRDAELVLPPTFSVDIAARRLEELPAGGRTPLAEGLLACARVLEHERLRDPRQRPLLVVVTDGRATGGPDAVRRSLAVADHLARLRVATVVVDGETGPLRLGLAVRLAEHLGAEHVPVARLSVDALAGMVRDRVA